MKNAIVGILVLVLIGAGAAFYIHKRNHDKKDSAFKVALVTPGPWTEGGWNQNAVKALNKIVTELSAKPYKFAAKTGEDAHTSFTKFASENKVNVIIGHGGEYNDDRTQDIAVANPSTTFLISGSDKSKGNVVGVRFVLEDATFVLGQLAASMSKSGKLACVGPEPWPVIGLTFDAFEQGAKSVKPDVNVRIVWTQNSADAPRAKEQTLQLIGEGVDFIFQNADNAGSGVFEAAEQSKAKGVYVFGSNDDQAAELPQFSDVILASAALDIPGAYLEICKEIKDGKFEKKTQFIDMTSGKVTVAFNKKLEDKIPADVRKKIDESIEKLKKGEKLYTRKELK
jgi:basic membrane protein A